MTLATEPYPSHSYVVVLLISISWLLERKCTIISTKVASKSNQHLKRKGEKNWSGKITLEEEVSKLAAHKIFIEATLIERTNNSDTSSKKEFIYRNHMHTYCPLSKGKIRIILATVYKDD